MSWNQKKGKMLDAITTIQFLEAQKKVKKSIKEIKTIVKTYSYEGLKVEIMGCEMTVHELLMSWDGFENKSLPRQAVIMKQAIEFTDILKEWLKHESKFTNDIENVLK